MHLEIRVCVSFMLDCFDALYIDAMAREMVMETSHRQACPAQLVLEHGAYIARPISSLPGVHTTGTILVL